MPARDLLGMARKRARPAVSTPRRARGRAFVGPESDASNAHAIRVVGESTVTVKHGASAAETIAALATAQRCRMARWQLLAAGLSSSSIDRLVHSGHLVRVHRCVYAVPGTAELPLARETAAVLACGPGAMLSHHSAAVLWQLRLGVSDPIHITVPDERRGTSSKPGIRVHRSTTLAREDIVLHHGLPVTSPARTLLDVAATLPDSDLERLLAEAVFARRLTAPSAIERVLARAGGHPGAPRLRRLIRAIRTTRTATTDTRTQSNPEREFHALIRKAGLPTPQQQVPVLDFVLDFYWPAYRLAVEVDTYATHGSPIRFASDRRRDARLLAEKGIRVIRFTDVQIERCPEEVIALLASALARAEAGLRAPL